MEYPIFYFPEDYSKAHLLSLEGDLVKHIVQVLRMQAGETLQLTDGCGGVATVTIQSASKKTCVVSINSIEKFKPKQPCLHLCVAFTKNASRNEWLLEKATELGIASIQPVMSTRTEKFHPKEERWRNILVSAMLQSKQYYLPELKDPASIASVISAHSNTPQQCIAHCDIEFDRQPVYDFFEQEKDTVFLIGPEGDFTKDEILLAVENGFKGINLGMNRLRTETAAMSVCAYFNMSNI
ncbi:MAG TPA: RsmE family RNA methyltransferase [Flavipsychrobacter sp.]|nr:RsmE family RNA methyltransferase [Flavipsychrobacter sp.]